MTFETYMRELADPSARPKVSGLVELSALTGEEAVTLRSAWRTMGCERRRWVARELVELAEDNVEYNFDVVFFAGLDDDDDEVRLEAVRGLWEYERPDLLGPLLRLAEGDSNAAVRAEAALALGRFVQLSEEGKLAERRFGEVEEALRRVIENGDEVEEVRARALEAIGPHDSAWVRQAIREAYESGARGLKASAVHAMGRSCEARWLPLVSRELASDEAEIRYEAALACGSLGEEEAVPQLAPLLEDDDLEVKEAAIFALAEIGGAQAKELLLGQAGDASESVREAANEALAEMESYDDPLAFRHRS
jgi:HEAT repeat protein